MMAAHRVAILVGKSVRDTGQPLKSNATLVSFIMTWLQTFRNLNSQRA